MLFRFFNKSADGVGAKTKRQCATESFVAREQSKEDNKACAIVAVVAVASSDKTRPVEYGWLGKGHDRCDERLG